MTMKTLFGAVAGALAVGAVLVSYDLGQRRAFAGDMMTPTTQMAIGPDGVVRPYLVQAGQTPQTQGAFAGQPLGWSPYGQYATAAPGTVAPYGGYPAGAYPVPVQTQYVTERVVTQQPVVRRVSSQRVASEDVARKRSWQKSALLIGGSAGAGAGLGALMGGKKGAIAGAAIGGGAAAIYDQVKRH
jgi:hypothetical protein